MGVLRWITRHRRGSISTGIVTAIALALGVMAFTYEGFTTTDVDLHDGGVWVTKTSSLQLGHLNVQAQELDGGLTAPSNRFDVLQDEDDVLLYEQQGSALVRVDPVSVSAGTAVQVPGGAQVSLGGGIVAILDPDSGRLWVTSLGDLGAFSAEQAEPSALLGEGASVAVGEDGSVYAASIELGAVVTFAQTDDGPSEPQEEQRIGLDEAESTTITVVGDAAVALDAASGTLFLPDRTVEVPDDAVLQQVGDASDDVVLATPDALVRQPLAGGAPVTDVYGDGGTTAVAPVQLAGCVYGVWPSSGTLVRDCGDDRRDLEQRVEELDGSPLVFRTNRGQVVLNQFEEGNAWLLSDTLVLVDNWEDLVPPPSEDESDEQDDESTEELLSNELPPPSAENHDPVANDDVDFGARPGRSTILPVLQNDSDEDGDLLTASVVSELPEGVTVSPITNDSQLQLQLPTGFSLPVVTFRYRVEDGRGGSDEATATVAVRDDAENSAPRTDREQKFQIEQTQTYEYQVLQDWYDPDGDDLFLVDAVSSSGDQVQFSPGGKLVYTATGAVGVTEVTVTVSDGRGGVTTGTILVDVRERGQGQLVANGDYLSLVEGEQGSLQPTLNDFVPSGGAARLANVTDPGGSIVIESDTTTGTVRILNGSVGTYYITYLAAAGSQSAVGRIRVDIRAPEEEARPVAVRDVALLPVLGETLVDLLDNDVDPSGGVLVVRSVEVPANTPVTVQLLERRMLRIVDNRGLGEQETITLNYQVSNGRFVETGQVVIVPVPLAAQPRPPVANDDTATLREGDTVTVDVTENDFSPDGTPFSVQPQIVQTSLASEQEGVAFVDGDKVRVHVLVGGPPTVTVIYEISDELGQRDTATVTLQVLPRDAEANDPPVPETVQSRVVAGSSVRIRIPLDGIDPDGDGVQLVGYESDNAPQLGTITATANGAFTYEAFPDSRGTDTFAYRVRDRWGAESVGTILVGVAEPSDMNQSPFAATDQVTVRPGRAIAIPVLDNDTDPDGDPLQLDAEVTASEGLGEVTVDEERDTIDLVSPEAPGEYTIGYTVGDPFGATAPGTVQLTVDEDAVLAAPVAVDDVIDQLDVEEGEPIAVPVLDNDIDVDGDPGELSIDVVTGEASVAGDTVRVVPSETFQIITYRVTDVDAQSAEAFIMVPPVAARAPWLTSTDSVTVPSGTKMELPLRDYVSVSSGNQPRITTAERVSATHGDGAGLVVNDTTLAFTSEAGYTGPASVTFEVTDGVSPQDPKGKTATLTIRIEVIGSSSVPPTFEGAMLQVEPGAATSEFDLRLSTQDPDPGDREQMTYTLVGGSAAGVTASIDERFMFRAEAGLDAVPGSRGSFQIEVSDPFGNTISGTVIVEVVSSRRAMAQAFPDSVEGSAGTPITVNVLQNDYNPFADAGTPLQLIGARIVAGNGSEPTVGEGGVTVTPAESFSGLLQIEYTVQDATATIARQVTGKLTVTVRNRPEAPIRPNIGDVTDGQVTLSWGAPFNNGSPITGYRVTSADGSVSQSCSATTCAITGLTNGRDYAFQVIAVNAIGESDPSPASETVRPDVRPEQPSAPSVEPGDRTVTVEWQPPVNRGSAITNYTVEISPAPPDGTVQRQTQGTSLVWSGLDNGTAYTFRVQAMNSATEPSPFSPLSTAATPAGKPVVVTGVRAERNTDIPGSVQIRVRWDPADDNGSPILGYTVSQQGGGLSREVTGANTTSAVFELDGGAGQSYAFVVTARNAIGTSDLSAASAAIRDVTSPGAPGNVVGNEGNGSSEISFSSAASNGARATEISYQYRVNGGEVVGAITNGQSIPLANGGTYTVEIRAVSVVDGVSYPGPWASSNRIQPFGPPPAPNASITVSAGHATFTWSPNGTNGRALEWLQYRFSDSEEWQQVSPIAGSVTMDFPDGADVVLQTRVVDVLGTVSAVTVQRASVPPEGEPRVWLEQGSAINGCFTGAGKSCPQFELHWEDLEPGNYAFQCHHDQDFGQSSPYNSGTVRISDSAGSSQSRSDGYPLCFTGKSGNAWMTLSGPSGQLATPKVPWP